MSMAKQDIYYLANELLWISYLDAVESHSSKFQNKFHVNDINIQLLWLIWWLIATRAHKVAQLQKERGFKGVIAATRKTTPG